MRGHILQVGFPALWKILSTRRRAIKEDYMDWTRLTIGFATLSILALIFIRGADMEAERPIELIPETSKPVKDYGEVDKRALPRWKNESSKTTREIGWTIRNMDLQTLGEKLSPYSKSDIQEALLVILEETKDKPPLERYRLRKLATQYNGRKLFPLWKGLILREGGFQSVDFSKKRSAGTHLSVEEMAIGAEQTYAILQLGSLARKHAASRDFLIHLASGKIDSINKAHQIRAKKTLWALGPQARLDYKRLNARKDVGK
jgi:hypothetical protein